MDTRNKILSEGSPWPEFPRPLAVASGYFDVLRADHLRELEEARRGAATLLVVVLARAGEMLSQRARAELVAGLRVVDYVALGPAPPSADFQVQLTESDERKVRELQRLVKQKSR